MMSAKRFSAIGKKIKDRISDLGIGIKSLQKKPYYTLLFFV
jgi:hypothetical protein